MKRYKKYPLILITDWSKIKKTDYIVAQHSDGSGVSELIKASEIHKDDKKEPLDDYSTRYYLVKDRFIWGVINHLQSLTEWHTAKTALESIKVIFEVADKNRKKWLKDTDYGGILEKKKGV